MFIEELTPKEWAARIGEQVRELRLRANIDRKTLCRQAGISVGALQHLEEGSGATLLTLIRIVKVLGQEEWLTRLLPPTPTDPLQVLRDKGRERIRASSKKLSVKGNSKGEQCG